MPDDIDTRLDFAAELLRKEDYAAAVLELFEAVNLLAKEGSDLVSSVSADKFQTPVFSVVTRVFSVFDDLPETAELAVLTPEIRSLLPKPSASPEEMLLSVSRIYEKAEEENPASGEADFSLIQFLLSLLSGQQSMRDALFSDAGMYDAAASSASPYLALLFSLSGDSMETAAEKAAATLFGPLKRLAELFYSLLTSSLTAGILLLLIRRAVPIMRPSKAATAVDAAILAASNIPVLIEGLRAVAAELSCLRQTIRGAAHGNV